MVPRPRGRDYAARSYASSPYQSKSNPDSTADRRTDTAADTDTAAATCDGADTDTAAATCDGADTTDSGDTGTYAQADTPRPWRGFAITT